MMSAPLEVGQIRTLRGIELYLVLGVHGPSDTTYCLIRNTNGTDVSPVGTMYPHNPWVGDLWHGELTDEEGALVARMLLTETC